jgi:hypothetical protein
MQNAANIFSGDVRGDKFQTLSLPVSSVFDWSSYFSQMFKWKGKLKILALVSTVADFANIGVGANCRLPTYDHLTLLEILVP